MAEQKGFFGKLKGLVVEETPDQPSASPLPPHPAIPPPSAAPRTVDKEIERRLEAAVSQAAPPAYTDLLDTVSELADTVPDEGSRFRAALKLARKRGHSLADVLGDIDKCIGVLEARGRYFQDDTKLQIEKKVGARQKAVAAIDSSIAAKRAQIEQLQEELRQLSEQRTTESAAIQVETSKIEAVSAGFEAAYDAVMGRLVAQRQKVESYGKAVGS